MAVGRWNGGMVAALVTAGCVAGMAVVAAGDDRFATELERSERVWREAGLCGATVVTPVARGHVARRQPGENGFVDSVADACGGCPSRATPAGDAGPAAAAAEAGCGFPGGMAAATRRFTISGIIGGSFGTLQSGGFNSLGGLPNGGSASDTLLTAGAAAGEAWELPDGRVRLELEGRGRDALAGTTPGPAAAYSVRAVDGWSVLTNVWRDWDLDDRWGVYGGGGIGGGGYRLTVSDGLAGGYGHVGGFAWQVGTGVTWNVTGRTTLDLGYRFFDTQSVPLALVAAGGGPAGTYRSNFYASELLLTIRIYEPFRDRPGR